MNTIEVMKQALEALLEAADVIANEGLDGYAEQLRRMAGEAK